MVGVLCLEPQGIIAFWSGVKVKLNYSVLHHTILIYNINTLLYIIPWHISNEPYSPKGFTPTLPRPNLVNLD